MQFNIQIDEFVPQNRPKPSCKRNTLTHLDIVGIPALGRLNRVAKLKLFRAHRGGGGHRFGLTILCIYTGPTSFS